MYGNVGRLMLNALILSHIIRPFTSFRVNSSGYFNMKRLIPLLQNSLPEKSFLTPAINKNDDDTHIEAAWLNVEAG